MFESEHQPGFDIQTQPDVLRQVFDDKKMEPKTRAKMVEFLIEHSAEHAKIAKLTKENDQLRLELNKILTRANRAYSANIRLRKDRLNTGYQLLHMQRKINDTMEKCAKLHASNTKMMEQLKEQTKTSNLEVMEKKARPYMNIPHMGPNLEYL